MSINEENKPDNENKKVVELVSTGNGILQNQPASQKGIMYLCPL